MRRATSSGVRVEFLELGVVQVAAFGRRLERVGGDGDDAAVGELSPVVVGGAPPCLPDGPMPVLAASAFLPEGRIAIVLTVFLFTLEVRSAERGGLRRLAFSGVELAGTPFLDDRSHSIDRGGGR